MDIKDLMQEILKIYNQPMVEHNNNIDQKVKEREAENRRIEEYNAKIEEKKEKGEKVNYSKKRKKGKIKEKREPELGLSGLNNKFFNFDDRDRDSRINKIATESNKVGNLNDLKNFLEHFECSSNDKVWYNPFFLDVKSTKYMDIFYKEHDPYPWFNIDNLFDFNEDNVEEGDKALLEVFNLLVRSFYENNITVTKENDGKYDWFDGNKKGYQLLKIQYPNLKDYFLEPRIKGIDNTLIIDTSISNKQDLLYAVYPEGKEVWEDLELPKEWNPFYKNTTYKEMMEYRIEDLEKTLLVLKEGCTQEMCEYIQELGFKAIIFYENPQNLPIEDTKYFFDVWVDTHPKLTDEEKKIFRNLAPKIGYQIPIADILYRYLYTEVKKKKEIEEIREKLLNDILKSNDISALANEWNDGPKIKVSMRINNVSSGRYLYKAILTIFNNIFSEEEREMIRFLCYIQEKDCDISIKDACEMLGMGDEFYSKIKCLLWEDEKDKKINFPYIIVLAMTSEKSFHNSTYDFLSRFISAFSFAVLDHFSVDIEVKSFFAIADTIYEEVFSRLENKGKRTKNLISKNLTKYKDTGDKEKNKTLYDEMIFFRENGFSKEEQSEEHPDPVTEMCFLNPVAIELFTLAIIIFSFDHKCSGIIERYPQLFENARLKELAEIVDRCKVYNNLALDQLCGHVVKAYSNEKSYCSDKDKAYINQGQGNQAAIVANHVYTYWLYIASYRVWNPKLVQPVINTTRSYIEIIKGLKDTYGRGTYISQEECDDLIGDLKKKYLSDMNKNKK